MAAIIHSYVCMSVASALLFNLKRLTTAYRCVTKHRSVTFKLCDDVLAYNKTSSRVAYHQCVITL